MISRPVIACPPRSLRQPFGTAVEHAGPPPIRPRTLGLRSYSPASHFIRLGPAAFQNSSPVLLRLLAGGWQINGLLSAPSGSPLTITAGKDQSQTGLGSDRAVYLGGNAYGPGACGTSAPCVDYLNPAAFALPAVGTFGNVGKGMLRGPNQIVYDSEELFKEFPIRSDKLKVQFRAEFFNLFNRVNLNNPGTSSYGATPAVAVSSGGFGSIKSAQDPRMGQLGLKLIF